MDTSSDSTSLYCRLCLENADDTQNYIDAMANNHLIHDKIVKIFHFTLDDEANFSPYICLICCDRIESIVEFIETVLRNQEKLKSTNFKEDFTEARLSSIVKQEAERMDIEYLDSIDDSKNFQLEFNDVKFEETEVDSKIRASSIVSKKKNRRKNQVKEEFFCDICSKSFTSKSLLVSHMKNHIAEPSFDCDQCDRRFQTANGLASHKVQGHEFSVDISKYLVCELCEDEERPSFESFNEMNDHYQDAHGTRGYVKCCSKKFFTKRTVVYHSEVHSRPIDFMCTVCKKVLPNKYSLRNHMVRHKPEEEKGYECHICQKRFHLEYDVKVHVRHVHEKNQKEERAVCLECDKTFASKISLYLHNRRFHMNLAMPMCETCGKQCRSKADLRSHIKSRHTETPRQKCDICGNLVKNMRKHKQIHVESALHIKCEICGHKTTTFKYLRLHMKIHNDEKPYVCSTCGQSFKRKKALNDHMSLHSGIPRHFCNYCDRTFNNSGNKFKHIKQAHPEEAAKNRRQRTLKLTGVEIDHQTTVIEPVIIEYQVNLDVDRRK